MTLVPRCGKPMRRFEAVWGALPEEPECGRPRGHNGPCRSVPAVARIYAEANARLAAITRPCACGCGEIAGWGHRYRKNHQPRDEWGCWVRDAGAAGWPLDRRQVA